jgi:hypothetical protein
VLVLSVSIANDVRAEEFDLYSTLKYKIEDLVDCSDPSLSRKPEDSIIVQSFAQRIDCPLFMIKV